MPTSGSRPSAHSNPMPACNLGAAATVICNLGQPHHYEKDDTSDFQPNPYLVLFCPGDHALLSVQCSHPHCFSAIYFLIYCCSGCAASLSDGTPPGLSPGDDRPAWRLLDDARVYLSPTQNILPFIQLVLRLVVCVCSSLSPLVVVSLYGNGGGE
jgi:hypothetical protein